MNITFFDVVIFLAASLIALIFYGKSKLTHFDGKNIKAVIPFSPYIGSMFKVFTRQEHIIDFTKKYYNIYPEEKYIGLYESKNPVIFLRDINIIKQVGIKEFDHFHNRRPVVTEDHDEIFGNILVFLQGDKWRDMRTTLSPGFTSSKMKNMFVFVEECAKDMVNYYLNISKNTGKDVIELEAKDTFSRYTNDAIANSAFGLKVQSLEEKDNEFYTITKEATSFGGMQMFKFFLFMTCPQLMKMLNISFLSSKAKQFYRMLLRNTMKIREKNSIVRPDMIQLLMEVKKGSLKREIGLKDTNETGFATVEESEIAKRDIKKKWTEDELIAQVLLFLVGGFDTTSTFLTCFFYELIRNSEIQKRLQEEIDIYISHNGLNVSYEDLPKLKYLDACVAECLRLWPPGVGLERVCSKTFKLPSPNEYSNETFQVDPGVFVFIPVIAIHHDPKYFPNPEKFDPERFSDENKPSIEPGTYLPFGIGPRNCIGSRFALMTVKLIIFHMLAKFDFVATKKTRIPLKLSKNNVNIEFEGGMHFGLKKRKI